MKTKQFEDPIDSAADLVQQNITLFSFDYLTEQYRAHMKSLNISEWTHVANNFIPAYSCNTIQASDYETRMHICLNTKGATLNLVRNQVHGNGTHAFVKAYLYEDDVYPGTPLHFDKKIWWRSRETVPGLSSYGGYLTTKKWILNEVTPNK